MTRDSCGVLLTPLISPLTGETSWEKPKLLHEKSTPKIEQPVLGDSGSDLSSLHRMREEAAAKMAALR